VASARGDHAAARRHYERRAKIVEAAGEAGAPQLMGALTSLGESYLALGLTDRAVATLRRARAAAADERDAAKRAVVRFVLARALWRAGRRAESLREAKGAREVFVAAGERAEGNVKAVDAWLAKHRR
jgi:hypothetical protein